ncbi:MAG: FecR family protein, partial [Chloroflexi bacterium]|nr:FecR family protein [Chloroflexota bacterium]
MLGGAFLPRFAAAAAPVVLAVALGTFLLVSQPAATVAASTLTVFAGTAEEQVDGGWRALTDGAAVRQGARLRTNAEGYALLTFPDGSTSSLDPSTEIAIERLAAGTAPRDVQIRQFSGRLWNDVVSDSREGARYVVLTQDATVQVLGTVFETSIDNGQTSVTTSEGEVDVVVGNERVSVPSGQIVRAQAQRVSERAPVQQAASSLTVDAPFAAALVSERGEATGARADGAMFRQIRGVTTSNPGIGPQRFEFHRLPPGDYTLLLQRFEQGAGDLVLNVDGEERRVP